LPHTPRVHFLVVSKELIAGAVLIPQPCQPKRVGFRVVIEGLLRCGLIQQRVGTPIDRRQSRSTYEATIDIAEDRAVRDSSSQGCRIAVIHRRIKHGILGLLFAVVLEFLETLTETCKGPIQSSRSHAQPVQ
jgi:hypothetical protein